MLHHLRRLVRSLYQVPVIGGLVQWVIIALRLPTLQRRQVEAAMRQAELAAHQQHAIEAALRETSTLRMRFGETHAQVAQFADRLAALESALARIDVAAQENLIASVPVALRRSAREIAQLRAQIGQAPCAALDGAARENA